jgi:myo-inositol catabolism protein IolC
MAAGRSTEPADHLFILAMDHRASLERDLYDIHREPTRAEIEKISAGKKLVFEGLLEAVRGGIDKSTVGVLVDERYGAAVARAAESAGFDLAMPIERSGQEYFTLEFGTLDETTWIEHIKAFDPDQVKILVRDNPDGPTDLRRKQFENLAIVSETLRELDAVFLFELVIPATDAQLTSVDKDALRYDRELRPELTVRVITEMQDAGVEPNIWKIEGLETLEAAASVVETARRGNRDDVDCIVLGRDAPADRLDHWLKIAAVTEGFIGFAIGRSVWEQPLADHLAGRSTEAELAEAVAANYTHFVDTYQDAVSSKQ